MSADRESGRDAVTDSSGNVFADLNLPSSEEDMLKVKIAIAISNTIEKRKLTQADAARRLGTDQAKVSAITRGRLRDFKIDRLFNYLVLLGHDVDIHISPRPRARAEHGRIRVTA